MPKSPKIDAAEKLARMHFEVVPDLKRVFLLGPVADGDAREPIKLLEVVEGAIEAGIQPIAFPSDNRHGINFPSVIVELSTREYEDLSSEEITFGDQVWKIERELSATA